MGMDEVDFVLLLEEAGRAGLAEPVIGTAAVAVPLLRELGGDLAASWLAPRGRGRCGHRRRASREPLRRRCARRRPAAAAGARRVAPRPRSVGGADVTRGALRTTPGDASRASGSTRPRQTCVARDDEAALACSPQPSTAAPWPARPALLGACDRMHHDRGRLHDRAQAVRPADRLVPGRQAPCWLAGAKVKLEYARPVVQRAASLGGPSRAAPLSGPCTSRWRRWRPATRPARSRAKQTLQCPRRDRLHLGAGSPHLGCGGPGPSTQSLGP